MRKSVLACLLPLSLLPLSALAQRATWGGGVGLGTCLEAHVGYERRGWLALARSNYHWWGPASGPGAGWLSERNTSSRQFEAAVLGGYGVRAGRWLPYGAAGLSYLNGRELGDFRYAVYSSSLLHDKTYYFAYRDYQVLGIPVEAGVLSPQKWGWLRAGLAFQADFNPQRNLYALVVTGWFGSFGRRWLSE